MRLWLYCIAGLTFDWLFYIAWSVIPLYAEKELRASAVELGVLQAGSSALYVVMSIVMGHVADRVPRPLLVRLGCTLMVAGCLLVPLARSVGVLAAVTLILGLAATCFWPSVQAAIASETKPGRLEHDIGLFNILWSTGKSLGFVTGAALKGGFGPGVALLSAAGGAVTIIFFYPWRDGVRPSERTPHPRESIDRPIFLWMSWIANFVGYGIGATIGNQYIKLCRQNEISIGFGEDGVALYFGLFLFLTFIFQTLAFAAIRHVRGWTYRRAPLYITQFVLAIGSLPLAHLSDARFLLLLTPLLGIGLGFSYAASLYYSLHISTGHGKFSGLHEAMLGSGNFVWPLLAGALATHFGDLRWPYWLCAGGCLLAIAVEEAIYRFRKSVTMGSSSANSSIRQSAPSSSPDVQ